MKESRRKSLLVKMSLLRHSSALKLVNKKSKRLRVVYDYEINKFTNVTTFHGLIRWYNGNWKAKFFWTLIIGIAVTCFIFQCVNSWLYFSQKPTVTTVEFVAQTNGSEFPSVTICNYNPVRKSVMESYNMSSNVLDYLVMAYLQVDDMYVTHNYSEIRQSHSEYEAFLAENPDFHVSEFFMEGGYECNEMFLHCSFAGLPMDCCKFAKPVLTDMGKCFQFQQYSKKDLLNRQYISGPYYGFQAFINVSVNEYPNSATSTSYESGIRAVIHPPDSLASVGSGGLSCSPGNKLYAGITQTEYILLPPEGWGRCKNKFMHDDFNINLSNFNGTNKEDFMNQYSSNNCEIVCFAQHFVKKCGCLPLKYFNTFVSDFPICDPLQMYNCSTFLNESDSIDDLYKLCPMCGVECRRWTYNVDSSYIKLPAINFTGKNFQRLIKTTRQQIQKNLVILNVYLSDVNYVKYQQVQATSLTQTLSAMGGNMGLFLGCSLVTCFEVLVFLCKVCYGSCMPKRRAKVQSKLLLAPKFNSSNSDLLDKRSDNFSNPSGSVSFYIPESNDDADNENIVENDFHNNFANEINSTRQLTTVYIKLKNYLKESLIWYPKNFRSDSTERIIKSSEQSQNVEPISFISIRL